MTQKELIDWKTHGVKVIPGNQLDPNTAQTPGMDRAAAINFARVGAQKIWAGTVKIQPNAKTGAHHHGALESVIYVVKGRARMRWGDQLEFVAEAGPGDFIFVPPYRAASGDQRLDRRAAGMRAGPLRQRGGGRQPRHRAGREAGGGGLGRPDPQTFLTGERRTMRNSRSGLAALAAMLRHGRVAGLRRHRHLHGKRLGRQALDRDEDRSHRLGRRRPSPARWPRPTAKTTASTRRPARW